MIRRPLLLLAACILLAGCGGPAPEPRTLTQGTLTAALSMNPDPPKVGHDSGFAVTLTENGQPLTAAQVQMAFYFKGLNQTGPTAVGQETAPGRYEAAEVSTGMGGKWEVVVTVTRAGQPPATFTFPFTVAK